MKITVEHVIDQAAIDVFYELYVDAFTPLVTRAAARHMLTAAEFAAEMRDPRIDKYVAWDSDGEPVALTTLATDLSAVAWISPEHMAARYPEHAARGAIYYLGYTLVHPSRGGIAFPLTVKMLARRMAKERAVCGYDVCAYNDARNLARGIGQVFGPDRVSVDRLDVQTYYAADFEHALQREAAASGRRQAVRAQPAPPARIGESAVKRPDFYGQEVTV